MQALVRCVCAVALLSAACSAQVGKPGSGAGSPSAGGAAATSGADALQRRVLAELAVFTDWLRRYHVRGYIGEVGWPDDSRGDAARWNALAERWYRAADRAGLPVTAWATGEWWGTGYPLAVYEDRTPPPGVDSADTQAAVIEDHPSTRRYLRGVNVAGGEFGAPTVDPTSGFSNENPGTYDQAYHYDGQATFNFLAARGIRLVRIPFRWERLQPALGRPLDGAELNRLRGVVHRAHRAGLRVVIDMHNYGGYYLSDGSQGVRRTIGSAQCPFGDFGDVWRRISLAFRDNAAVVGYDLMNEPAELRPVAGMAPAQVWRRASQAAVSAIRSTGDRTTILVAGYEWSGVQRWARWNPRPWIVDPVHHVRYEAHQYWDPDNSGIYAVGYAADVADARARGY